MQRLLDGMKTANEEGLLEFERRERELQQRLAAGEHARREQSRQQSIIDDAEQARRELAQLQSMRNQLTITNGVPTVVPQPAQMASSSARIEEITSPPTRAATTSSYSSNQPSHSSSNHNPIQQRSYSQTQYNPYLQPHPQMQAYTMQQQDNAMPSQQLQYPPQGVQSAYGHEMYQHLPNGAYQNNFQARPPGSASYNGTAAHLSQNNQLNTNNATTNGIASNGRELNAVSQQSSNLSNLQSRVSNAASTTVPTVGFDENRELLVFSGYVNAWAKHAPDNSSTFSPHLQLYVFKGQEKDKDGQPKRVVSVQVKEPSGRMRTATREDLVSRIRQAYLTHKCVPPLQGAAPGSTQVAQNVPNQQPTVNPRQLYTSTPLVLQTSTPQSTHQTGVHTAPIPNSAPNPIFPPSTPKPQSSITEGNSSSSSRTPAQVDKSTLAKDILRFLVPKRPRTDDQDTPSDHERESKRQAMSDSLGVVRPAQQSDLVQSTLRQAQPIPQQMQPTSQQTQPIPQQTQPNSQQNATRGQFIAVSGAKAGPHDPPMKEPPATEAAALRLDSETLIQKERPQTCASDKGEVSSPPIVPVDLSESTFSPSPPPPTSSAPEMHAPTYYSSPSRKSAAKGQHSPPKRSPSKPKEVLIIDETPPRSPQSATPLFLASPATSSSEMIVDSPPKFDQRTTTMMGRKAKGKRIAFRIDCVEIPPPSDWVKGDLESLERKKGKQSERVQIYRGSNRRIVVNDTEDLFGDDDAAKRSLAACVEKAYSISHGAKGGGKADPEERAIMKLATTRLQSLPCTWQSCDAVMNSAARLEQHLIEHIKRMNHQEVYTCRWQQCGRSESRREQLAAHVVSHALSSLQCPYSECEEGFRQPRQLLQHSRRYHSNSPVKPSADPFVPTTSSPPMCPDNLPSYMVVARQISPYSISRERHDAIGPVVCYHTKFIFLFLI
ncbi:hypothetical protein Moror_13813 [Moniliophthora roreri MCA 2997]|uniref:C2H2-type domain-containing protein n=1 Tax=Moniliophthora roreri (strain MCA 2997) TaxID=1381753 RepID=V2XQD3_MONRO|nr:hypothetical protein Moror_13813 [Moniliophthora roreri MCA 2997]